MQDVLVGLLLAAVPLLRHPPAAMAAAGGRMAVSLLVLAIVAVATSRLYSSVLFRSVHAQTLPVLVQGRSAPGACARA
jgi:hypothetical protein